MESAIIPFNSLSFTPLRWLRNCHLQTFFGCVGLANEWGLHFRPHLVNLEDGDQLYCDEAYGEGWDEHHPTAILIHGLGGSSRSQYILRLSRLLLERSFRVVRMSLRGSGPGLPLATRTYHGGLSGDLLAVSRYFYRLVPASPQTLIGYSLGGNLALKLAGEQGALLGHWVRRLMAVCPPFDLAGTVEKLSLHHPLYEKYFVYMMRKQYGVWANYHGRPIPSLPLQIDQRTFDDHYTARMWGFHGAGDYYRQASCGAFLSKIAIPSYIIGAWDDPIVDNHTLERLPLSRHVRLLMSHHGGHMGFFGDGSSRQGARWIDRLLLQLLDKK